VPHQGHPQEQRLLGELVQPALVREARRTEAGASCRVRRLRNRGMPAYTSAKEAALRRKSLINTATRQTRNASSAKRRSSSGSR
jgi:hypothetical protein